MVPDPAAGDDRPGSSGSLIDELVREGAQRMLAEAVQAEVDACTARFREELDEQGHRLVVRNGYHQPREVTTTAGPVQVTMPRVNDKRVDPDTGERQRFASAILPPWARKTRRSPRCYPCSTCTACVARPDSAGTAPAPGGHGGHGGRGVRAACGD
ncbi:mutator family transposase [Amycolatopsis sulphurea]|uniref:Mutator family transposase n=1 Tax=Amycolatopsis sulphurea TaxID=76022 RepID=A0A2A9G0E7_9PSEU|nr:mutator family transposase [Amycolatopsis sulphurea]